VFLTKNHPKKQAIFGIIYKMVNFGHFWPKMGLFFGVVFGAVGIFGKKWLFFGRFITASKMAKNF